jgi:hypothetical protein
MTELKIMNISTPYLLGAVAVLFIGYRVVQRFYIDARIRKLGARAPVRKTYVPYGLDMAYEVITYALKDKSYEMWVGMFEKWCGPGHYTIEAGVGERVLLTAEPENIKAILATQFKDYGKGEQFRKDWHTFLGNGTCTRERNPRPRVVWNNYTHLDSMDGRLTVFEQASSPPMGNYGITHVSSSDHNSSRIASAILTSSNNIPKFLFQRSPKVVRSIRLI